MTWTRAELKTRAKRAFYKNYWVCVLVTFILGIAGGNQNISFNYNSSSNSNYNNDYDYDDYDYNSNDYEYNFNYSDAGAELIQSGNLAVLTNPATLSLSSPGGVMATASVIVIVIVMVIIVIMALVGIFLFQPILVGGCHFFMENAITHNAGINPLAEGFKRNYKGVVLTMFLRNLYTALWTLLLIVPGIIKGLEYRMVPYILADHPEMTTEEVFALSKKMMDGEKWDAFVLDLSFLGWQLLALCTCGILNIFYVNPYIHATNAELYLTLKRNKCQSGYQPYESYGTATNYGSPYIEGPYNYN